MRSVVLLMFSLLPLALKAQVPSKNDVTFGYEAVRTNATPGVCGCFLLSGVNVSASHHFDRRWAIAGEFSYGHTATALATGDPFTMLSYRGGLRYHLSSPGYGRTRKMEPFGEVLFGMAHVSGVVAGVADSSTAFSSRLGGGLDFPVGQALSIRAIQADWDLTQFANASNSIQNNLVISAGFVFHLQPRNERTVVYHPSRQAGDPPSGVSSRE